MILASHYLIRDILHTVEAGDVDQVRLVCKKFVERYQKDDALVGACNVVLSSAGDVTEEELNGMRLKLEDLLSVRRLDSSGGTGLWFSDRRKIGK